MCAPAGTDERTHAGSGPSRCGPRLEGNGAGGADRVSAWRSRTVRYGPGPPPPARPLTGFREFGPGRTQTGCSRVVGDVSDRLYSDVHPNRQHRLVEGGGGVPWVVGSSRCFTSNGSYLPLGEEPAVPLLFERYSAFFARRIGKRAYTVARI